jgi:hypothetical protein
MASWVFTLSNMTELAYDTVSAAVPDVPDGIPCTIGNLYAAVPGSKHCRSGVNSAAVYASSALTRSARGAKAA